MRRFWRRVSSSWRWACARGPIAWSKAHRATVGFLILGAAMTVGFAVMVNQQAEFRQQSERLASQQATLRHVDAVACRDRIHQYVALHDVIAKSYAMTRPSAALLDAFPQLKPFYTPGNPQYEAQVRSSNASRDGVLRVLGRKPKCVTPKKKDRR